jgi:hypothetical protein
MCRRGVWCGGHSGSTVKTADKLQTVSTRSNSGRAAAGVVILRTGPVRFNIAGATETEV